MIIFGSDLHAQSRRYSSGFTLVELVIIIVTLGIIASVAIPKMGTMINNARINSTKDEMRIIKRAIIGNADIVSGGQHIDRGFEGDIGFAPANLVDLIRKPDSIAVYDKFNRIGWNGPYLDSSEMKFLIDAWDSSYVYNNSARTITSVGGDPDIVMTF